MSERLVSGAGTPGVPGPVASIRPPRRGIWTPPQLPAERTLERAIRSATLGGVSWFFLGVRRGGFSNQRVLTRYLCIDEGSEPGEGIIEGLEIVINVLSQMLKQLVHHTVPEFSSLNVSKPILASIPPVPAATSAVTKS